MKSESLSDIWNGLTDPQRAALGRFVPGVKRPAYPDINPRTATALWSKRLIKGETIQGVRLFLLTDLGKLILSSESADTEKR